MGFVCGKPLLFMGFGSGRPPHRGARAVDRRFRGGLRHRHDEDREDHRHGGGDTQIRWGRETGWKGLGPDTIGTGTGIVFGWGNEELIGRHQVGIGK